MNIFVEKVGAGTGNRVYASDVECSKETRDGYVAFVPKYDDKGASRERDVLATFAPEGKETKVRAYWTSVALNFDAGNMMRLVFRTQTTSDRIPLEQLVPVDQEREFIGSWENKRLAFALASSKSASPEDQEVMRLRGLTPKGLKTEAAERGVAWDNNASIDTMIKRIADKAPAATA